MNYCRASLQFIEVHKQYESTVASVDRPASDIINGIMKMEADEKQLLDRLQREQAQMNSNSNFQRLLAEASEMRQAQDDEIRLEGQKREQLNCFASAKQRLKQSRRILEVIKICEGKTSDLDREFDLAVHHLETTILPQHRNLEVMLLKAEKEAVSDKTEEMATQLEEILSQKQNELDDSGRYEFKSIFLFNHIQPLITSRCSLFRRRPMMQPQNFKPCVTTLNGRLCSGR